MKVNDYIFNNILEIYNFIKFQVKYTYILYFYVIENRKVKNIKVINTNNKFYIDMLKFYSTILDYQFLHNDIKNDISIFIGMTDFIFLSNRNFYKKLINHSQKKL